MTVGRLHTVAFDLFVFGVRVRETIETSRRDGLRLLSVRQRYDLSALFRAILFIGR